MNWLAGVVERQGLAAGSLLVLLGGLALNLTPCVYPMIPITLAFFGGQAAGSWRRATMLAGCYVLGLSVSYAILGLVAASTGALLGAWLQRPVVLVGVAAIIVVLSLGMFGLYELRPPHALTQRLGQAGAGSLGAMGMGAVVGLVAAPCIGPFILALIVLVGQRGDPATGLWLFFMLGIGMGLPYLLLGAMANQVSRLPKSGAWLVWSKRALGVVLLGLALYMVRPLLPRAPAASLVAWQPYSAAALEAAARDGRRAVIDIYADWCIPCIELDHVTFRDPAVVQAMASVSALRLDVTREVPEEGDALLDRYRVFGVPTVLLFDRAGAEREDLRILGFIGPEAFLQRLEQLQ
jgi:thiol:disulfide interchange protein DsbD